MPRLAAVLGVLALALAALPAGARERSCARAVLIALPGVTWEDVAEHRPQALLGAARAGAAGSISVRTVTARTSYASGFATIGAGARLDGGGATGGRARGARVGLVFEHDVAIASLPSLLELAEEAGYNAVPGALGGALGEAGVTTIAVGNADAGSPPPAPAGFGRFSLLATMDRAGVTDLAAVSGELLMPDRGSPFGVRTDPGALASAVAGALALPCSFIVIDQGDLVRADAASALAERALAGARAAALAATDRVIGLVRRTLGPDDLLLVVSPTSPAYAPQAHLGVALAVGPGFPAGSALRSATTRRDGLVTLPDVAPTVLAHFGVARPPGMTGRPFVAGGAEARPLDAAVALDREAVFVDSLRAPISTAFVAAQVLVYALAVLLLRRRRTGGRALEVAALGVAAFPAATYLAGATPAHELGRAGYAAVLLALDAALVALVCLALGPSLDRLLALLGVTFALLAGDLVSGGALQLNTVFGYSPIVAGRFSGAGNIAFAVLGASGLLSGALLARRLGGARGLALAAAVYGAAVVVDGAPAFGSDVGGVLALVPALALTWVLLSGRRPDLRVVLAACAAGVVVLAGFLALDLARPPEERTHLARLFEDVRARGAEVLLDTVARKAEANLRVFRSTIWTYLVPPAVAVLAWLLFRPRGRWQELARRHPEVRHGLAGGLVLAVLGFAVNDSGIVVPAVILCFLVPLALVVHLAIARGEGGAA